MSEYTRLSALAESVLNQANDSGPKVRVQQQQSLTAMAQVFATLALAAAGQWEE